MLANSSPVPQAANPAEQRVLDRFQHRLAGIAVSGLRDGANVLQRAAEDQQSEPAKPSS
jgi:hypothetical protein